MLETLPYAEDDQMLQFSDSFHQKGSVHIALNLIFFANMTMKNNHFLVCFRTEATGKDALLLIIVD